MQLRDLQIADLAKTAEDAAYIAIGVGVLTYKRVADQVTALGEQVTALTEKAPAVAEVRDTIRARLTQAQADFEAAIEPVVDAIEERLPEPAKAAVANGRKLADEARTQLRSRIAA